MRIIDKDNILPNPSVLEDVIANHPFHGDLANQLNTVTVGRPNQSEGVHIQTEGNDITLVIFPLQSIDDQHRYLLYHEIGHVADRLNPAFKYYETIRENLRDHQRENFVELWNLYIDARLNRLHIYRHSPGRFLRKLKDTVEFVERTHENQLVERIDYLFKRGFCNPQIVHDIWNHPEKIYTSIDLVDIVKENTIKT